MDALLEVLHTKWDRHEVCNGIGASALGQDENMVDEGGQPLSQMDRVDKALEVLVHNATEEFGFAPRDVYRSLSRLHEARREHAVAAKWSNHSRLMALVETFSWKRELDDVAERVVVVYPRRVLDDYDSWSIDFKSVQIGREVMESLRLLGGEELRETYNYLHRNPEAAPLARWVFEVIARRAAEVGAV